MPVLLAVAARYPALQLNVSFTDRRVDLVSEGIDLAVRLGPLDDSPDVVARRIGVQRMVIVGAPGYLAARGVPQVPDELEGHDCIVGRLQGTRAGWLLKQPDGSIGRQTISVKHEVQDFEMVQQAVTAGYGLAQLPDWMVRDDIQVCRLLTVLEAMSGGEMPINIVWLRTMALPAKVRIVVDGLVKGLTGLAAADG